MKCWNCGSKNFVQTPTMIQPLSRGADKIVFTVCKDCWEVNEFVNGRSARIIFVPLIPLTELIAQKEYIEQ